MLPDHEIRVANSYRVRLIAESLNKTDKNDAQRRLFTKLLPDTKYLVFDLSSIFTRSENMRLAEKGRNPEHLPIRKNSTAMLFSHEKRMPAVQKSVPGSVRDPKVFRSLAKEYSLRKLIDIADRGSSPGTI